MSAEPAEHMGHRIRRIRKQLGLSQERFAASIGIAQSSLSQIEQGQIQPSHDTLRALHAQYRIPYDYLMAGTGPLHLAAGAADTRSLVPRQTDATADAGIPLLDQRVLAGTGAGFADPPADALPRVLVPGFGQGIAVQVAGNSMEPTLRAGDIVLCTPVGNEPLRDNHVYVIVTADGALVKRVLDRSRAESALLLKSDNREFATQRLPMAEVLQLFLVRRRITADLSGPDSVYDRLNQLEQAVFDLKAQQDRRLH